MHCLTCRPTFVAWMKDPTKHITYTRLLFFINTASLNNVRVSITRKVSKFGEFRPKIVVAACRGWMKCVRSKKVGGWLAGVLGEQDDSHSGMKRNESSDTHDLSPHKEQKE